MTSVVVIAHHQRSEARDLARQAAEWLRERNITPWMPAEDIDVLGLADLVPAASNLVPQDAELVLSLGGDGTVLRSVHLVADRGIPVMGVNVGLLGYLTEVEPEALTDALELWRAGTARVEERLMVEARIGVHRHLALNEVVIEKSESGHTVRLDVHIDGAQFTTYQADGLIIATPTGSTAYSLSARGPIVSPTHRALLVTPVSPHMLFDRALVLDPAEKVDVQIVGHRSATLSVDGRNVGSANEGDTVYLRAASETARFVRVGDRRFHQVLKAKFGLEDR